MWRLPIGVLRRRLILGLLCALPCGSFAAVTYAQSPSSPAAAVSGASGGDGSSSPLNLLWSALGSGPIAALLYSLLRGEQTERRATVAKMLESFESDADHRAQLRERLKGQDDALVQLRDLSRTMDQRLAQLSAQLSGQLSAQLPSHPGAPPGGGRSGS